MAPAPPQWAVRQCTSHPADGTHRCLSCAPGRRCVSTPPHRAPGRPRASMPRLLHRGGAHRRSWAPPYPAGGLGRGYGGNEHTAPCAAEGWLCWRYAAAVRHRAVGHGSICPRSAFPRCRRITTCARNALSAVRRRQGAREMHSQAPGGGDMLTLCVPRCLTMAIFCPDVSPKRPQTGKRPLRGNISPPCIQNELALARYARHASEKPCKSPLEDTPREYLARKGPFSLHKLLESCTARRSCHDSAFARPCARKARGAGYRKRTSYCDRRSHPMIAYVCGSRARSRQLPLCGRWRKPMTVSAAASEQYSGAYARPVLRHLPARSVCLANGIRPPAATFAAGASRRPRAQ